MSTRLKQAWLALLGKPIVEIKTVEVEKEVIAKRSFLGSIDKDQVQYIKGMSISEHDEHVGSISSIYQKRAFSLELNSLMDSQVYWMGEQADGDRQHLFGKGTLNGIQLVLERFQLLDSESRERTKPKEKFDDPLEKYGILSDLSTKN